MSNNTKSKAKRMGVKSVLAYGKDGLSITSFDRGNSAKIVLNAKDRGRYYPCPQAAGRFTVRKIAQTIEIENGSSENLLESLLHNPAENIGKDYLGLKETLEQEFFGQTFPNDNIRIQIIHNILDILKILGIYVNDIVYTLGNLQNEGGDIIGLSLSQKNQAPTLKKMKDYFGLFGNVFTILKGKKNKQENDDADKRNYNILRILGTLRQNTAHWITKEKESLFKDFNSFRDLFKKQAGDWDIIEKLYKDQIESINRGFFDKSKMNLHILFDLLAANSDLERSEIIQDYYRFTILKTGKNLGVSLKKIREQMLESFYPEILKDIHNSYRSKLYTIADFIIFRSLRDTKLLDQMVEVLRMTSDEEEKEAYYKGFGEEVWKNTNNILLPFFRKFNGNFPVFSTETIDECLLGDAALQPNDGLSFIKVLSFMCNFLEGKEINELLTAYIHKFENIQAFLDTLSELGEEVKFSNKYKAFNGYKNRFAEKAASQIRILASIGKMKPDMSGAKRVLFRSAIQMLGAPQWMANVSDSWLEENILLNPQDEKYKEKKKDANPFRNFIAKNVINSRRFVYLVRYTKPASVRALMRNQKIVHYVLTRLPDKQIDSYYKNIEEKIRENADISEKWNALTQTLSNFSFENLWQNRSEIVTSSRLSENQKDASVVRLRAMTGLYLTVAYVAIKNLIKANARYYIAFAAMERDLALFDQKLGAETLNQFSYPYSDEGEQKYNRYAALTRYFLAEENKKDYKPVAGKPFDVQACRRHQSSIHRHFTKKWRNHFEKELAEAELASKTGYLFTAARNHAEHLNVMIALPQYIDSFCSVKDKNKERQMTSYFQLYHYLLQRLFEEDKNLDLSGFAHSAVQDSVPCKDLIHASYVSLAYNLARYKNLTTAKIFDPDSSDEQED